MGIVENKILVCHGSFIYLCVLNSPLQSGGRQDRFRMWSGLVLKLVGGMDDVIYHSHLHCGSLLAHPRAPHSLLQSRVMTMNELGICILLVILVSSKKLTFPQSQNQFENFHINSSFNMEDKKKGKCPR